MVIKWDIISTGRHSGLKVVPAMKLAENTRVVAVSSRSMGLTEAYYTQP